MATTQSLGREPKGGANLQNTGAGHGGKSPVPRSQSTATNGTSKVTVPKSNRNSKM